MYGRRTLTWSSGGTIWQDAANGTIYFIDIDNTGTILCDITTPWGELFTYETLAPGECKLYVQTLGSPFREHTYTVKLVNSSTTSKTADIQALSCAYKSDLLLGPGGINQLYVTHDIPNTAIPSSTLNYNYKITNNSASSISLRYILATNVGSFPMVYTTSSSNCGIPLPPIINTSKKCWYDDWISGTYGCQAITVGAGVANLPLVGGSVIMPGSGDEMFTLGIFVEVANYWASGKNEWVMPVGFQSGYLRSVTANSCSGVICDDGCIGNDLYSQHCSPSTGLCEPDTTPKEVNSLKCTATHVFDIGIKPYSWTSQTAATDILAKIVDGTIGNTVSGWFLPQLEYQYLGVDTFQDGEDIVIRIYLKQLQTGSLQTGSNISSLNPVAWTPLIVLVAVVVLAIGPIIYYKLRDWVYKNILSIRTYTTSEVSQIILGGGEFGDGVLKTILTECDTNCASASNRGECLKICYKSAICGAANGSVDTLGLPTTVDCTTQKVNEKIDACYTQYLIDSDLIKFKTCMTKVKENTGGKVQAEADKKSEGGGMGFLLLGAVGLAMLGMMTTGKGGSTTTIRVQTEKESNYEKIKKL